MQIPRTHRLLAVDVGNSRVKFGLFYRADIRADGPGLPRCLQSLAASLDGPIPWETIQAWMEEPEPDAVTGFVAGANPRGIESVRNTWPDWLGSAPVVVDDPGKIALIKRVDAPEKVGIDRLLNAVAANLVRPPNRPAIIVSSGTATTVDYVAADGAFEGGAILPGFDLAARSLNRYTALLPLISIEELASSVPPPLGRDTRLALRSGLFWGQLGAVKELIRRLSYPEHGHEAEPMNSGDSPYAHKRAEPFILLTGGGASLLYAYLAAGVRWEPNLSVQGLAVVASRYL